MSTKQCNRNLLWFAYLFAKFIDVLPLEGRSPFYFINPGLRLVVMFFLNANYHNNMWTKISVGGGGGGGKQTAQNK